MIRKTKRVAGEFRGTCRLGAWLTETDLPPGIDLDALPSRWDKKLGAGVFLQQCAVNTADRVEFEHHMKTRHEGGVYRWDNGSLDPHRSAEVRSWSPKMKIPVQMWKAPRLHPEGKPFEPADFALGAELVWPEVVLSPEVDAFGVQKKVAADRTGQVWCFGGPPKSVWVVPTEPQVEIHPEKPLRRREQAVLLRLMRDGKFWPYETTWSAWREASEVAA